MENDMAAKFNKGIWFQRLMLWGLSLAFVICIYSAAEATESAEISIDSGVQLVVTSTR